MANWCYNYLTFKGDNYEKGMQLFEVLYQEQDQLGGEGILPVWIKESRRCFFDILVDSDMVYFLTKWSPPIEEMERIGEELDVDFELEYIELGNALYGVLIRRRGEIKHLYLEAEDFNSYEYNEELDVYKFEGKLWESEEEICELILERKFEKI